MGEGAGVLVMESLEHAQKRGANILCEYLGGALTCDAYHMTDPRADGLGVSTCIELALANAKLDKDAVGLPLSLIPRFPFCCCTIKVQCPGRNFEANGKCVRPLGGEQQSC